MFNPDAGRGSALISALFIMTLVAIAATAMSTRLQLDIYRTRLTLSSDQLYLASQVVTFWAMDTLAKEKKPFTTIDKKGSLAGFPIKMQTIYPGVKVNGDLYDMQALFNINNLQDLKFHPLFERLFKRAIKNNDDAEQTSITNAIYQWISPYQAEHDDYSNVYLSQTPPYMPSYQAMQSISELRLVSGVSQAIYQKLQPYVTVLPETTAININTAPKLILRSLGNGLNDQQIDELLQARSKKGVNDLKIISPLLQKLNIPNDQITIESTYYLCIATATSEDLHLTTYTVISRTKDKKGRILIGIVSESLNTM